jgi:hypothetical protein
MISRDFFSVANNLGDSVAFNLESDTAYSHHQLATIPAPIDHLPQAIAIGTEIGPKKFKIPFDRDSPPIPDFSCKMRGSYQHT